MMSLMYNQWFHKPLVPEADFAGKTVLVTGANTGLGKEAVKHYVRLNAAKVIATSRTIAKGEAAKAEIEEECGRNHVVEVWELDYSHYGSVKAFGARAAKLPRLDIAVLNAGVAPGEFELLEDNESSITVNVISNSLLMLLLLPSMRRTAVTFRTQPVMSIVSSGSHFDCKFPERSAPNILERLNQRETAVMGLERYPVSKLLQILCVREIAEQTKDSKPMVVINLLSPGLCLTELTRNASGFPAIFVGGLKSACGWTAEMGSRNIVNATLESPESHGVYISEPGNENQPSPLVVSKEGQRIQKQVWKEITVKLEKIQPGVTNVIQRF